MSDYTVKTDNSNHQYFAMTPHIIYEIGLKANEIAVYGAIKRCSGEDGVCVKSKANLAKSSGVCPKTIFNIIQRLCQVNPILGKPLLKSSTRHTENGDYDTNQIEVIDIWPENMEYFKIKKGKVNLTTPHVNVTSPKVTDTGGVRYGLPEGQVTVTDKEEPLKKNPFKKNPPPSVPVEKTEEMEKNRKNAIGLSKLCKDKDLPFTQRKVTALYNMYPQACLDVIVEFSKRKPDNMALKFPDTWLNKHVIEQHEFLEQKKDYEI